MRKSGPARTGVVGYEDDTTTSRQRTSSQGVAIGQFVAEGSDQGAQVAGASLSAAVLEEGSHEPAALAHRGPRSPAGRQLCLEFAEAGAFPAQLLRHP